MKMKRYDIMTVYQTAKIKTTTMAAYLNILDVEQLVINQSINFGDQTPYAAMVVVFILAVWYTVIIS
jgi:hypothetical protein